MFFTSNILIDVWKFYRVKDWVKNLGIPLVALFLARQLEILAFFIILIHSSFLLAYSFSINDFFDFKLMEENNYTSKKIKQGAPERGVLLLILLPFFGIFATSLFLPFRTIVLTLIFIILFGIYSCPPLRLKRHWLFSLLINPICIGVLLFLISYFSMSNQLTNKAFMFVIVFFSYIFSTELIHQIAHMKKDKKARIRSFPNEYGIRTTLRIFQFAQFIVAAASLYLLYIDFYLHAIFIGTILFSLLRTSKVRAFDVKSTDFEKMRNRMYGSYEGIYYIIWLTFF